MDSLVITGVPPYDGEYPLDFGAGLTNGELHQIKKISGIVAGQLADATREGDNDLVVAFAAILLERAGKPVNIDVLWNAPLGAIEVKKGDEDEAVEGDARPPDSQTNGGDKNKPDAAASKS